MFISDPGRGTAPTPFTVLRGFVRGTYDQRMEPTSAFALLCPVCGGRVEKTGERDKRSLFACVECDCDVSVPEGAWDLARIKREEKWQIKRSAFNPLRRIFGAADPASVASGPGTRHK